MPEKLVRDRIPDLIRATGTEPRTRTADPAEYEALLRDKLTEEVAEFLASDGDPAELADILEVVYAVADALGVSRESLERLRAAKERERGAFRDRVVWAGNVIPESR